MNEHLPIASRLNQPSKADSSGLVKRLMVFLALCVGLPLIATIVYFSLTEAGLDPVVPAGEIVYVPGNDEGVVYLLSGQWKTIILTSGRTVRSTTSRTDLFVDLWAFDAGTMTPAWRRRIAEERDGSMLWRQLLGEDRGTVWLLNKGSLEGFASATGDRVADVKRIEDLNPELRGLLPTESRYFGFDSHGLRFTAADGRDYRIAGDTLRVAPAVATDAPAGPANVPAFHTPGQVNLFQARGIDIPGFYLGMFTEAEAQQFVISDSLHNTMTEVRRELWQVRAQPAENFFGERLDYLDARPLPSGHDYLSSGLLAEYYVGLNEVPIWLRDPDSVLVLHKDRLGDEGRFLLTRVAGPEGNKLWETRLPLSHLQSVVRTSGGVVLFGYESFPDDDDRETSLYRLVSVNTADGTFDAFFGEAFDNHSDAVPAGDTMTLNRL